MDLTALGVVALLVALVALAVGAAGGVIVGRSRAERGALAAEVQRLQEQVAELEREAQRTRGSLDALSQEEGPTRQEAREVAARLESLGGALEELGDDLAAGAVRADGLDARVRLLEGRLRDLASEPPPIPSGRRPGRLDDLRAVLRAQAASEMDAEEADEPEDGSTTGSDRAGPDASVAEAERGAQRGEGGGRP
jgi:chromosome segregation ATPase